MLVLAGIAMFIVIILLVFVIPLIGLWMLIIGAYDTLFAHKASFWSVAYLIIGFVMIFGGGISGRATINSNRRG